MEKRQTQDNTSLLDGIQGEVSQESAPLMRFIVKYSPVIAGVVLTLLIILAGVAIWKWYHGGKQDEARKELARIHAQMQGAERDQALARLAENAPDSTKLFIYLSLGQSAEENGNPVLAADAYAKAASIDGDHALGLTAALNSAGSLLMQAEYNQALVLLQELEKKLPQAANAQEFQQMLAEAAAGSGDNELARRIYQKLADSITTPEKAYFQHRAEALAGKADDNK